MSLPVNDFKTGLAALYGYEKQIPEVSQVKIDGLKKFYNIDSEKALGVLCCSP